MQTVLIAGMGYPGLFLAREFGKRPCNLYCIGRHKNEIGMYSKYGRKYVASTGQELREVVEHVAKTHGTRPIALVGSGIYLDFILDEFPEFVQMTDFVGSDLVTLKKLNSKVDAYEAFRQAGIKVPRSFQLTNVANDMDFPLIVKWSTKMGYDPLEIAKTTVVDSYAHFEKFAASVKEEHAKELIVQEFISGTEVVELGYGAYYDHGTELARIVFYQKRQYGKGIASCAVEFRHQGMKRVERQLQSFLSGLHYNGFVEIDLLFNVKSGDYHVLDVNPRPWASIKMLGAKYPGLIDHLLDPSRPLRERESARCVCFVRILNDLLAVVSEIKKQRRLSVLGDVARDYRDHELVIDEFDGWDLRPLLGCLRRGAKSVFKPKRK